MTLGIERYEAFFQGGPHLIRVEACNLGNETI